MPKMASFSRPDNYQMISLTNLEDSQGTAALLQSNLQVQVMVSLQVLANLLRVVQYNTQTTTHQLIYKLNKLILPKTSRTSQNQQVVPRVGAFNSKGSLLSTLGKSGRVISKSSERVSHRISLMQHPY